MAAEPNLNFDIDALFDHMTENLGYESATKLDWSFSFRSPDFSILQDVAEGFGDEYEVHLQEDTESIDAKGNRSKGEPMLSVVRHAALDAEEVKAASNEMSRLAKKHGLVYEGVESYQAIDDEEMFGWLEPDEATWILQHMTEAGLEPDAALPWAFLITTASIEATSVVRSELATSGFRDVEEYDEPDDDGEFGLCVFVAGQNNQRMLEEAVVKIASLVKDNGRLDGVQFYAREDVEEVFGGGD